MAIHYMDDGFGPHADRGFDAASAASDRSFFRSIGRPGLASDHVAYGCGPLAEEFGN